MARQLVLLDRIEASSLSPAAKAAGAMLVLDQVILQRTRYGPFARRKSRKVNALRSLLEIPTFEG
jgi:hypothetical protein